MLRGNYVPVYRFSKYRYTSMENTGIPTRRYAAPAAHHSAAPAAHHPAAPWTRGALDIGVTHLQHGARAAVTDSENREEQPQAERSC